LLIESKLAIQTCKSSYQLLQSLIQVFLFKDNTTAGKGKEYWGDKCAARKHQQIFRRESD